MLLMMRSGGERRELALPTLSLGPPVMGAYWNRRRECGVPPVGVQRAIIDIVRCRGELQANHTNGGVIHVKGDGW